MYYNENRKSGENVERKLKTRHLYRHFKGKLYYVMNIGLEMFLSKVDIKKYPNVE